MVGVSMNLYEYKKYKLLDLFNLERAKQNKKYNKNDIIIQVSVSKGQIYILNENQCVKSQYIVLHNKNENIVDSEYSYYILQQILPSFLRKYQTGLNIQPEIFNYLEIEIHNDLFTQKHIVNIMKKMDEDIKKEEELLKKYQDFKKYHIGKMFC